MLSICLSRSCFRLWFIRHMAHFQYFTPLNSSQRLFCSKNSPTPSCCTNTENRNDPLILVLCRVDVTLKSSSGPKHHFLSSTVWAAVRVCVHMKTLYVSGKSTLVVKNFLTNPTDPELRPRRRFHLTDRLAFNVFQNFVLLDIH